MRRTAIPCLLAAVVAPAVMAQGFTDVTAASGLGVLPVSTGTYGSGMCCGDFDGDGDLDLVVAPSAGQPIAYFRNDGGFVFTDQTAGRGLGTAALIHGMATGDVDNDGDLDLFVGNWSSTCELFLNDGSANFTPSAVARGITGISSVYAAAFGDYDCDGWLDLYVGNRGVAEANILYRNLGGGFFQDVTAQAGVGGAELTFVVTWMDYDEDGWPDILVVNDKGHLWQPNNLWRNNGDGTFTSVAAAVHADGAVDGMGVDFIDVFNDGGVDFFVSDAPPDHLFQVWDPAQGVYVDATATFGLAGGTGGWSVAYLDYDNDGWQDLYVVHELAPNHLYRNPGQPVAAGVPWPNVAPSLGMDQNWLQFTTLRGDFDDDGGIDLVHRFDVFPQPGLQAPVGLGAYRNNVPRGNWLSFSTRGVVSNRSGIGARVDVIAGGVRQRQWVRSGTGYQTASDLRVHFGLGTAAQADLVEVHWPSGQVQYLTDVPANQFVEVIEPSYVQAAPAVIGTAVPLQLSIPGDAGLFYVAGLAGAPAPGVPLQGGRVLPLHIDDLTLYSITPGNPVLQGFSGLLDPLGRATVQFNVPLLPWLAGLTIYSTAVTLDPAHFPDVRTVFPAAMPITIQ